MEHSFYNKFIKNLRQCYPSAPIIKEQIQKAVSPFIIEIPSSSLSKMKVIIQTIDQWSRKEKPFFMKDSKTAAVKIKNRSVLMAYDFHLDEQNTPQLIEINTNASGFLVIDLIQKSHGLKTNSLKSLEKSFFEEWNLFSKQTAPPLKTAIVDDDIDKQKMKFEFFMYHDLMNTWGWKNEILEAKNLKINKKNRLIDPHNIEIDFIYNRLTDFYLNRWPLLKQACQKQTVCFSPHPKEYFRSADKRNLCFFYHLSKVSNNELLQKACIPSWMLDSETSAWENRKKLFFKPIESYGGRGSYRGKTITKKKFSELKNYIVQKYTPPGIWKDPIHQEKWKFDIRAYVYQNQIQLIGGRIYKGQATNFQTPLGGFCLVQIK